VHSVADHTPAVQSIGTTPQPAAQPKSGAGCLVAVLVVIGLVVLVLMAR
jgi:hypothetical protein